MPNSRHRSRSSRTGRSREPIPAAPGGVSPEDVLGPLNDLERLNAPKQLFLAGNAELLRRRPKVSIVGSRNATPEGLRRAAKLAKILAENGVVVISGLAKGIDTAAHRAAMDAGGSTIAVIGTPLNKVYPRENAELQREIAEHHLVVSQFPEGYKTRPWDFPMRNRTMALIVDASVIVEAGDTSGSLSQGWEALRLARALFFMKSIEENKGLTWPKKMMEYGAQVLGDPGELLDALPYGEPLAALSL
jgi:DNA processing protein